MLWNVETLTQKADWLLGLRHQLEISRLQLTDSWPNSGLNSRDIYCSLTRRKELVFPGLVQNCQQDPSSLILLTHPQGTGFCCLFAFRVWRAAGSIGRQAAVGGLEGNQLLYSSALYQKSTTKGNLSYAELFTCKWPELCHMTNSKHREVSAKGEWRKS